MLKYLFILFVFVPLLELALLIKVGRYLGVFNTIALIILSGAAGAWLTRREGLSLLRNIERDVNSGILPADKMFDGFIILASGFLLLTPGIITDIIGITGLIPWTRKIFKEYLKAKFQNMINQGRVITITSFKHR